MSHFSKSETTISRRETLKRAASGGLIVGSGAASWLLSGCGGHGNSSSTFAPTVSYQWVDSMLQAISIVRPGPPMTARAIGMVATAAFDAWACYDAVAVGTRKGGRWRRPAVEHTLANKNQAISFAALRVLLDLYPTQSGLFNAKMVELGYNPADTSTDLTTPTGVGNEVARVLLEFRHQDGSNQLNNYADTTGYVPVNTPDLVVDPSQWQQLRFANGAMPGYIAPHWGNVVPFALSSPSILRPGPPPAFNSPTYRDQCLEVINVLSSLNDRSKTIAEYWADGPGSVLPPGHWQRFGQLISQRDRHTLDDDVKMYFLLGNAVMDAGIACWDCKRFYNTSRPITAVRALFAGQQIASFISPSTGVGLDDGANWKPYQSPNFITPPFPEYTSGHSTFSAASAEILKRFTRSDDFGHSVTISAGSSAFEPGVPAQPVTLSWDTFTEAANEAGNSRIYGGIHFRAGNQEALRCGRQVGDIVWNIGMSYIDGSAPSRIRD